MSSTTADYVTSLLSVSPIPGSQATGGINRSFTLFVLSLRVLHGTTMVNTCEMMPRCWLHPDVSNITTAQRLNHAYCSDLATRVALHRCVVAIAHCTIAFSRSTPRDRFSLINLSLGRALAFPLSATRDHVSMHAAPHLHLHQCPSYTPAQPSRVDVMLPLPRSRRNSAQSNLRDDPFPLPFCRRCSFTTTAP